MTSSKDGSRFNALAKKMQRGDAVAAEKLYNELFPKVYGFCMLRVRQRTYAEDLTQEIFLKIVARIDTFDASRGTFLVWFWSIVRNTLTDFYRAKQMIPFEHNQDTHEEISGNADIEREVESKMLHAKLQEFIRSLDDEEQMLFEMRYVAELPYREISDILEKSEGSLRVASSRLKTKIKKKFT